MSALPPTATTTFQAPNGMLYAVPDAMYDAQVCGQGMAALEHAMACLHYLNGVVGPQGRWAALAQAMATQHPVAAGQEAPAALQARAEAAEQELLAAQAAAQAREADHRAVIQERDALREQLAQLHRDRQAAQRKAQMQEERLRAQLKAITQRVEKARQQQHTAQPQTQQARATNTKAASKPQSSPHAGSVTTSGPAAAPSGKHHTELRVARRTIADLRQQANDTEALLQATQDNLRTLRPALEKLREDNTALTTLVAKFRERLREQSATKHVLITSTSHTAYAIAAALGIVGDAAVDVESMAAAQVHEDTFRCMPATLRPVAARMAANVRAAVADVASTTPHPLGVGDESKLAASASFLRDSIATTRHTKRIEDKDAELQPHSSDGLSDVPHQNGIATMRSHSTDVTLGLMEYLGHPFPAPFAATARHHQWLAKLRIAVFTALVHHLSANVQAQGSSASHLRLGSTLLVLPRILRLIRTMDGCGTSSDGDGDGYGDAAFRLFANQAEGGSGAKAEVDAAMGMDADTDRQCMGIAHHLAVVWMAMYSGRLAQETDGFLIVPMVHQHMETLCAVAPFASAQHGAVDVILRVVNNQILLGSLLQLSITDVHDMYHSAAAVQTSHVRTTFKAMCVAHSVTTKPATKRVTVSAHCVTLRRLLAAVARARPKSACAQRAATWTERHGSISAPQLTAMVEACEQTCGRCMAAVLSHGAMADPKRSWDATTQLLTSTDCGRLRVHDVTMSEQRMNTQRSFRALNEWQSIATDVAARDPYFIERLTLALRPRPGKERLMWPHSVNMFVQLYRWLDAMDNDVLACAEAAGAEEAKTSEVLDDDKPHDGVVEAATEGGTYSDDSWLVACAAHHVKQQLRRAVEATNHSNVATGRFLRDA